MNNQNYDNVILHPTAVTNTGGINFSSSSPNVAPDISSDESKEEYLVYDNDKNSEIGYNKNMKTISEKTINIFLGTIAVTIAVLAVVISIASWTIDKNIDSVNNNVNAKFETITTKIDAINQRLDYQEKLNSIQIQRDVATEMKKK